MNTASAEFLPSLVGSARVLSSDNGRRRRLLVALRLIFVTLAAVFGALSITQIVGEQRIDLAGVAAVMSFVAVLGIRLVMLSYRDLETAEARAGAIAALAESHAWRYAVGARPYPLATEGRDDAARNLFLENLRNYQQVLLEYSWTTPAATQITEHMSKLRSATLAQRKAAYLSTRVDGLLNTSSDDSRRWGLAGRRLFIVILCIELLGIPAGALKAFELTQIDLLGIIAASAVGLALWASTLALPERARSAAAAGMTLASAGDSLSNATTEHEWSALTARVEDQLSLEFEAVLATDAMTHPLGGRRDDIRAMSPDEFFAAAEELKRQIWEESDRLPKLEPDVIVALNPGGAILGGMLYFMTTRASDFLPLSFRSGLSDDDLEQMVASYPWSARRPGRLAILVVDASVKSGESMMKAVDLLKKTVEAKGWVPAVFDSSGEDGTERTYVMRTAVITKSTAFDELDRRVRVDYYVDQLIERFPYGNI